MLSKRSKTIEYGSYDFISRKLIPNLDSVKLNYITQGCYPTGSTVKKSKDVDAVRVRLMAPRLCCGRV